MMNFNKFDDHPTHRKWVEEADQLELYALQRGCVGFANSLIDDIISDELESDVSDLERYDPYQSLDSEHKLQESADRRLELEMIEENIAYGVYEVLNRRACLLGPSYPFLLEPGRITLREDVNESRSSYLYCLKYTRPHQEITAYDRASFEEFTALALRCYLGERAASKVFGWRAGESCKPARFREAVEQLYQESGEWRWNSDESFPDDPDPKLIKDCGIDVVTWLPSCDDSRVGKIFLVSQCATGQNWESKLSDVCFRRLRLWVRNVPDQWSIRCFVMPFDLPNHGKWKDSTSQSGLLFDRVRLVSLLGELPEDFAQQS